MEKIINSPKLESLKDSLLSASIMWWLVATHQTYYKQAIEQILTSSFWQFWLTLVNAYTNLRIYNWIKQFLYKKWLDHKKAKNIAASISWIEVTLVIYFMHTYIFKSKDILNFAIVMGTLSSIAIWGVYEKFFLERRRTKEKVKKIIGE